MSTRRYYDRKRVDRPRPVKNLKYRFETLIGITGLRNAQYSPSWKEIIISPFNVLWRPHLLLVLVFEVDGSHSLFHPNYLTTVAHL